MPGSGLFAVVQRQRGPKWDLSRPMEEQVLRSEHAAFMNGLVDRGFVVPGGPPAPWAGAPDRPGGRRAGHPRDVREDPWSEDLLLIESIETWTLRLGELP